jgi:hypothetical protein
VAAYKELLSVIGKLYGANEEVLAGKMRGRLQNLAKMGIPSGGQLGKGKSLDYDRCHIYQVIMCLELAELGLNPSQNAGFMKWAWGYRLKKIFESEYASPSADELLFIFSFDLMSKEWKQAPEQPEAMNVLGEFLEGTIAFKPISQMQKALADLTESGVKHFSVINITAIVRDVEREMAGILPPVSRG